MSINRSHIIINNTGRKLLGLLGIMGVYAFIPVCAWSEGNVYPLSGAEISSVKSFRETFSLGLRTNMLYDALLVPNIGAEAWLGKQWSVGTGWMYTSLSNRSRHRYVYLCGGDINVRYWFGVRAKNKSLTGHHLGVYAGAYRFDFEWGGDGYMGGPPNKPFLKRLMYNVGVEYGYSLPVARRLNIDFTVGFGYFGGNILKYEPVDMCYVWKSINDFIWWGPNKVEISLVWLLSSANFNRRKGGRP